MKNIFKNKKVRIFSLATMLSSMISTGIFIQSCSNETEVLTLDIPEEYNEVGKLHNEGLEYVFTQIKAQAIESVKNPDIKSLSVKVNNQEFIKQVTIDFCEKNKRLKNSFGVYEQAIENVLNPRMALKSTALENVSPSLKTLQDAVTAAIRKEYKKEELSQLKFQLD
ncbi:MAG: hypothetical protein LBK58_03730, partial [Prevotellaceae bacterium]|nr:hypothetical protein [Prevotellaceae bacterium]